MTFSLTTSTSDAFALTTGNDTVTGASGALQATDSIIDSTSTDADTLTATVTTNSLAPIVRGVETITLNGEFNAVGLDFANVRGATTVNFAAGITGTNAVVGTAVEGAGVQTASVKNIVFGTNVSTATVTGDTTVGTAGQVSINPGSLTTLTFAGASVLDNFLVTPSANITLAGTNLVETLKVAPSAADKTITLTGAHAAGNVTEVVSLGATGIKGAAADLTGRTITNTGSGTLSVEVSTGTNVADLSKVATKSVSLTAAILGNALTVPTATTITTALDQGHASFTVSSAAVTAATNAVTFVNTAASQTGLSATNIKTFTVKSAATAVTGIDATYAKLDAGTNDVVLTGTNDVKVTLGTAKTVDASALVGSLNYTQGAGTISGVLADTGTTIKGGTLANTVTLTNSTTNSTYVGQNGGDSLTVVNTTGVVSATTGSGNDTITATGIIVGAGVLSATTGAGDDAITANALTSGTLSVTTGDGNDTVSATGLTTGVVNAILGAGNDTVTLSNSFAGNTATFAIDGGDGTDTISVGAGTKFDGGATPSVISLTSIENIALNATGTVSFAASQVSGKTYNFMGTATATTDLLTITGVAATTTVDASTLTMDQSITKAFSNTKIDASASAGVVTIKGTAVNDDIRAGTVGSSITGGAGSDNIACHNGGVDKIFYTATNATTLRTEANGVLGAAAGTTIPTVGATGVGNTLAQGVGDTITNFVSGTDKIVLSLAFGTATVSGTLVPTTGTSYTTASTGLAAADFISYALATDAVAANAAGGGRFLFNTVAKTLTYDALGDTVIAAGGAYTAGGADDFTVLTTTGVSLVATDFAFV